MTSVLRDHSVRPDSEDTCHLDPWWLDSTMTAIGALAATGEIFTTDNLRDDPYSLPEPRHSSHWGAAFSMARRQGLIRPVGYAASRTASRNGGVLRLWRGTGRLAVAA